MKHLFSLFAIYAFFIISVKGQSDLFDAEQILFEGLNTSSPDRSFLAGDFNGDGHLDFAGSLASGLSILSGNGDLTYDTISLPDEFFEFAISIADMNNDGLEDLVSTNAFYTHDSLDGFERHPFDFGSFHLVRFAADINKDGFADIIGQSNEPGETPVMFLHRNLSGTSFETSILDNTKPDYDYATAGDYNSDSWIDILIAETGDDRILLYRNSASGTIIKSTISVDGRVNGKLLDLADMDGDLDPDIITGGGGDPFEGLLYLENVNTTFSEKHEMIPLITQAIASEVLDIDGDGDQDVIAITQLASGSYRIGYVLNMGVDDWSNFELLATFTQFGSFAYQNANIFANWLQLADVDGDGRRDIIVNAIKDGEVLWFRNLSTTSIAPVLIDHLALHPQPANDYILFDGLPGGNHHLILFDKIGIQRMQADVHNHEALGIQTLESGLYFYQIKTQTGPDFIGKVIVIRM